MKTKDEKIYAVEFMEYTNWEKVCVSSNPGHTDAQYLDFGKETCLVKESDLPIFQKYGNGFRSITCVGVLHVPEDVATITVNAPDVDKHRITKDKNLCKDNCMAADPQQITIGDGPYNLFDGDPYSVTLNSVEESNK